MHKLESLRSHLLSIPGEIKIDADDLLTFADNGMIVSNASGTNQHFELKYKANIIITNYSGQADQLAFWMLQWLKVHQPDHNQDAIQFEADLLNEKSVDLSLSLDISETIKVDNTVDGIVLTHCGEPDIEPVLLSATDWALFANTDEVANWIQNG